MIGTYIVVALVAYLLGSIPFGYILLRLFRGQDVRATGSGNIGATNVARSAPGLGLLTLLLDASKGYCAVALAIYLANRAAAQIPAGVQTQPVMGGTAAQTNDIIHAALTASQHIYVTAALAALFAIIGHVFPLWLKFRGGKGVATGVGTFLALAPRAIAVVLVLFLLLVLIFRYVSLGSIVAAAAFPVFAYLMGDYHGSMVVVALMAAASLLIILKHHQNIRRLLAGTEHRFTLKGKSA